MGAFGKPSLGVRNSQTKSSVEREGPTITQAIVDTKSNSRYEATQQSVESIPTIAEPARAEPKEEEVAESTKPLSFLERRALEKKGGAQASYQPSMVSNSNIMRPN